MKVRRGMGPLLLQAYENYCSYSKVSEAFFKLESAGYLWKIKKKLYLCAIKVTIFSAYSLPAEPVYIRCIALMLVLKM